MSRTFGPDRSTLADLRRTLVMCEEGRGHNPGVCAVNTGTFRDMLDAIEQAPASPKVFVVGKAGVLSIALAVFSDRDRAEAWKKSANRWYGEEHPLTPLTVWANTALVNPRDFPDPNGSVESIFEDIDQ